MLLQISIINDYFYTLYIALPDICDKMKRVVEGYTNYMSAVVCV